MIIAWTAIVAQRILGHLINDFEVNQKGIVRLLAVAIKDSFRSQEEYKHPH
jgi:hypothetical protein